MALHRHRHRRAATATATDRAAGVGLLALLQLVLLGRRGRFTRLTFLLGLLHEHCDLAGDLRLQLLERGLTFVELRLLRLDLVLLLLRDLTRRFGVGLALGDLFLRLGEAVDDLLVALRGERAVLLARRQVLRVLRVELLDATGRTALRVDDRGAAGDLGPELGGLGLGRRDQRVGGADVGFGLVELVLRGVDLLVEPAELLGVAVDLSFELCGLGLLVADRVGDRDTRGRPVLPASR